MNEHRAEVEQILTLSQWGYQARCSCGWVGLFRDAMNDYAYTECDAEVCKHILQSYSRGKGMTAHNIELPPLPPLQIVPSVEPVDYPDVAQALMDYARAAVEADRQRSNKELKAECERLAEALETIQKVATHKSIHTNTQAEIALGGIAVICDSALAAHRKGGSDDE